MSYLDSSDWTERDAPADAGSRRGRHRARHAEDAAPEAPRDPYDADPEPYGEPDPFGWDRAADAWSGDDRSGFFAEAPDEPRYDDTRYDDRDPYPDDNRGSAARRRRQAAAPPPTAPPPTDEPPPARKSRAGRNLPAAIGVGLLLGAVVLSSLFFYRPAFLGVVILAVFVATWEMVRAVQPSGAKPPLIPLLVGGALMEGLAWFYGPDALSVGLLLTVLATMIWRLADGPAGYHRDVTAATLVAVYVPFLGGFATMLGSASDGEWRVLAMLVAVVLSDTGGYVTGVFFGKHPLAPSVSPKKSWEGLVGSLVVTAAGSAPLLYFLLGIDWWWGALFGLAVAGASVLGDLAESLLKRDLGIKDMSTLLPGHGGLMDRLDSILFAAPVAYLLLSVLSVPTV